MSDIRKWLRIMENVPAIFPGQPPKEVTIKKDATVMVDPRAGGGTARYMHSTPTGAMVDIKGVPRELSHEDFSLPERDYENPYQKGNDWFHMSQEPGSPGSLRDKPEFRSGDMVKVADVYGAVIGPGIGIFIAYGTTGQDAVISFDGKELLIPVANLGAALEQNAKDNFGQMDNDGALSPMSLGSDNVKIEQPSSGMSVQEPAMDHRDEFSKWIAAVEGALSTDKGAPLEENSPNACGCGNWDCGACFPDAQNAQQDFSGEGELSFGGPPEIAGEVCPTCGHECAGHDDGMQGMGDDETEMEIPFEVGFDEDGAGGMGAGGFAVEEEPMSTMDEEENEFIEKPKSGKGVKLGDIVHKTEFRKVGGESPLTHGDSLEEDGEDREQLISAITSMQDMGISKDNQMYSPEELQSYTPEDLKQCYARVMGEVSEEEKPTKTKSYNHLDDLEDLFAPKQDHLPAGMDDGADDAYGSQEPMNLPTASRSATQDKTRQMTPSDSMRELMSRMDRSIGDAEPAMPDNAEHELVVRTANEVPAVISSAMQASGTQSPQWHQLRNLPGMDDRAIRAMGKGMFGVMTNTPVEDIKTIANVNGQGPNTEAEVRAVASWLRDNAEDLGDVEVSHGQVMPGYNPEAHDYKANGVRFHVVRDQGGVYIYAYPDKDARLQGSQSQAQGELGGGANMPRLRESTKLVYYKPTLFEQLKWDEEISAILKESALDENMLDESSLSRLVGKNPGSKNLITWLHKKHKLGNDAEIVPAKMNSKRLLWKSFKSNPDQFIVVIAQNGVAGIKPDEEFIKRRTEEFRKKGKDYNPGGDSTLPYEVVAFTADGEELDSRLFQAKGDAGEDDAPRGSDPRVIKARMGLHTGKEMQNPDNVFNLIAEELGPIRSVYLTGEAPEGDVDKEQPMFKGGIEREKMAKRGEMKQDNVMDEQESVKQIFQKVRPVLKTLGNQALSQINRSAQRYINGGNFEAAQKIVASGQKLKQFLVTLDTSGDIGLDAGYDSPTRVFTKAITGAISRASGAHPGSDEYKQWANDAAKGNSVALKPILDALRDTLSSLT